VNSIRIVLLVLLIPMLGVSDDDLSEVYTCSFTAHTPIGYLNGGCTTQSLPAPEFVARWTFTLTFDPQAAAQAAKIQPDSFYDMVRGQCLQDGSFTNVIPLWGDFVIRPDSPDYIAGLKSCAPFYQVAPNRVTLTRISIDPFVVQFLFEERPEDLDSEAGGPSQQWLSHYLNSFRRLQQSSR
jgi:hypothetical protein